MTITWGELFSYLSGWTIVIISVFTIQDEWLRFAVIIAVGVLEAHAQSAYNQLRDYKYVNTHLFRILDDINGWSQIGKKK